jgi:hypothetical protein
MIKLKGFPWPIALILWGVGAAVPVWPQTQAEAGFITLEENDFYFHSGSWSNRIVLRSSPARIWFVYQPADVDPASKPLFVFFNGGPGGATSSGLLSANTGRTAVWRDEASGASSLIPNAASWTRMGNLLYVDSRTTGFSYSLMDNPASDEERWAEFDAQNYNPFIDGADFVRVLLRFMSGHPALRANRVVFVPESYGGIRVTVMLHLLLYYENYANGREVFQDPGLVEEIRGHYEAVFPDYAGQTVPPGVIAGQFSHQVLIQTALTWPYQRSVQVEMLEATGSILDQVAAETGTPYVRYRDRPGANQNPTTGQVMNYIYDYLYQVGRDPYICSKQVGYLNGHREAAQGLLTRVDTLSLMIGVNATGLAEMYASARDRAYKTKLAEGSSAELDLSALIGPPPGQDDLQAALSPADEESLAAIFGRLAPWDRFFIDLNYDVADIFAWNRVTFQGYGVAYQYTDLFGRLFLENTAWVETFATDAALDIVVFTPSLPAALALHTSILSGAVQDTIGPPGSQRPGRIFLTYRPDSVPGFREQHRTIRFPHYAHSGHAVTLTEPQEMLEDVRAWLEDTRIFGTGR